MQKKNFQKPWGIIDKKMSLNISDYSLKDKTFNTVKNEVNLTYIGPLEDNWNRNLNPSQNNSGGINQIRKIQLNASNNNSKRTSPPRSPKKARSPQRTNPSAELYKQCHHNNSSSSIQSVLTIKTKSQSNKVNALENGSKSPVHDCSNFISQSSNQNIYEDHDLGKTNDFDYKIVKKNKLLIPATAQLNTNNLKWCQKQLLPKEKNYFVSEKNFQKITACLNKKEIDIKNMETLLTLVNVDLKESNKRFNAWIAENEEWKMKIEQWTKENTDYRVNYDDWMFQINKINEIFGNMVLLLKYIQEEKNTFTYDSVMGKVRELELNFLLQDTNGKNSTNDSTNTKNNGEGICNDNHNILSIVKTSERSKKWIDEYNKKWNDAENIIDTLSSYVNNKNDSNDNNTGNNSMNQLSDIAQDMWKTKKRILELTENIRKLEYENSYLRLNYQSVYKENQDLKFNKSDDHQTWSTQIQEKSSENEKLGTENVELRNKNMEIHTRYTALQKEMNDTKSGYEDALNKNGIWMNTVKDKCNIINEWKSQIVDYDKKWIELKGKISQMEMKKKVVQNNDELNDYWNKSSDEIILGRNQKLTTNQATKTGVLNTKQSDVDKEQWGRDINSTNQLYRKQIFGNNANNLRNNNNNNENHNNTNTNTNTNKESLNSDDHFANEKYNKNNQNIHSQNPWIQPKRTFNKYTKSFENLITKNDDEEINKRKDKKQSLGNDESNHYFQADNETLGAFNVEYIGDLFYYLYNQAKTIESYTLDTGSNYKGI